MCDQNMALQTLKQQLVEKEAVIREINNNLKKEQEQLRIRETEVSHMKLKISKLEKIIMQLEEERIREEKL